jgi:cell wall-associated NlpC family hydrolase
MTGAQEALMCPSLEKNRVFQIPAYFGSTALAAILVMQTSCGSHRRLHTIDSFQMEAADKISDYSEVHDVEKRIRDEYMRWKGTPHRLGGNGRGGVDCSGFVRAVYKNAFNVELPRTTKGQLKEGMPVNRDELRAGDLVFFKPPNYPQHVGIFLRQKAFVHASKRNGVIISQIDQHYWGKYYWTARRIFAEH